MSLLNGTNDGSTLRKDGVPTAPDAVTVIPKTDQSAEIGGIGSAKAAGAGTRTDH